MQTGVIKKLMDRGFGFLQEDDGSPDALFFHASKLADGVQFDDLQEGMTVKYTRGHTEKGPQAEELRPFSHDKA